MSNTNLLVNETSIVVNSDVLSKDVRLDLGVEYEFAEPMSSSRMTLHQVDRLFSIPEGHMENFPSDDIGLRAEFTSSDALLAHLVSEFTDLDSSRIKQIIDTEVHPLVNLRCLESVDILCEVLAKARDLSNMEDTQDSGNHMMPVEFYQSLDDGIRRCYDSGKIIEIFPNLQRVVQLTMATLSQSHVDGDKYHTAWTLFLTDLLKLVAFNYPMRHKDEARHPEVRFNGVSDLSFPVIYETRNVKILHCKPDCLVELHQCKTWKIDENKLRLDLSHPVLALEVKTTEPHSAGFVEGAHKKGSSSSTSDASQCVSSNRRGIAIPPTTPSEYRTSASSRSSNSSSYVRPSHSKLRVIKKSISGKSTSGRHRKRASYQSENVSMSTRLPAYNLETAEKRQMDILRGQHRVQLIGILKWSAFLTTNALNQMNQVDGFEVFSITKNPSAYGLFMVQNRMYLTKLSVEQDKSVGTLDFTSEYIHNLGNLTSPNLRTHANRYCSLRYKVSDVYLDILDPIHLKAFLAYLRIIIWHEQKCTFSQ